MTERIRGSRRFILDDFTARARVLFDKRFSEVDLHGYYNSHQPIYGFRQGHAEPFAVYKYIRSYQILKALSHLRFSTLLDVGGAEGYKAALVSRLLGAKSISSDLSPIACRRGVEFFGIASVSADVSNLPFGDGEFDIVLCSETLEHVWDPASAIDELLRIAEIAVIVTVPHDPESVVKIGMQNRNPLGHLHRFDQESLQFLEERGHQVITRRMLSWATVVLGAVVEAMPVDPSYVLNLPHRLLLKASISTLAYIYNLSVPTLRRLFGKGTTAMVIELDEKLCRLLPTYCATITVILKDHDAWIEDPSTVIRALQVVDFAVPLKVPDQQGRMAGLRGSEAPSIWPRIT